jgi:hypothetical protein
VIAVVRLLIFASFKIIKNLELVSELVGLLSMSKNAAKSIPVINVMRKSSGAFLMP